ncbi:MULTISPECIES: XRE family transcriptional regulator [Micromonospora]|uniref:Cupin domain-containing protein n=1 Tax=Micromonospora solifontis TaxID=2487138 RepID=A0ABX9W931_9ACTN|nr:MULTISPECIES: XRE family transcriptional regulator [Micromonospora]NES16022.1 cupin domain-containing protein [Micromonospora sp. PPF5-17B]NES39462.1 cupin domain-containing protein [Micromonospora solifontis]NES57374.1 cupin domain-containing protein [Micromonospora sp. PPF5-6]RNL88887.1 cupin domain-containing protein [Micromonospora solifontis]
MTDAGTGRVSAVTSAVAGQVRELRAARGWSFEELAGRSGVSKGMLVQIEGARTNPSIGTLCRVADAFGVSIARLLEPAEERSVRISASADAPVLWRGERGGMARLLNGTAVPDLVELWEWRLEPGEAHRSPDHPRGTREILHVLDGAATVTVDGVDHDVRAGETIEFLADREHGYRPAGTEPLRLMMVVVTPSGEWDRRTRSRGPRPS